MNSQTVVMCVVALLLGMLLANMLKSVCGCKNIVEGQRHKGNECYATQPECSTVQTGWCDDGTTSETRTDECYKKCGGKPIRCT